jgi:general stress protein 26
VTGNVKKSARKLARKKIALTGSVNADGAPGIKAMAVEKREGMKTFWFASNVGSQRAAQYMANPRACLYFFDRIPYRGLILEGAMEVLTDEASRRLLWRRSMKCVYRNGRVDDPDYCVLRFIATHGRYYFMLETESFSVDD